MRSTIELALFFGTLVIAAWFLSAWMQRVYDGRPVCLDGSSGPVERLLTACSASIRHGAALEPVRARRAAASGFSVAPPVPAPAAAGVRCR